MLSAPIRILIRRHGTQHVGRNLASISRHWQGLGERFYLRNFNFGSNKQGVRDRGYRAGYYRILSFLYPIKARLKWT